MGIRIREDGVPIPCVVVAAPKPDGQWTFEMEGVEGSQVLLRPESLLEFAETIVGKAREQGSGDTDG